MLKGDPRAQTIPVVGLASSAREIEVMEVAREPEVWPRLT
jgi:hypothetical protein